jgi:SAM-dependent methyltransferase
MTSSGENDIRHTVNRYSELFSKYGHSQEALGWGPKGRQTLRFEVLANYWSFEGKHVVDLGAGFGDIFPMIAPMGISSYIGIELTPALVEHGNLLYSEDPRFELRHGDISTEQSIPDCDIVLISGLFNFKLLQSNNYEFIESVLRRSYSAASDGVAANFVIDRVDYEEELMFYTSPERLLSIGLSLTNRLVLRSDYMPFEYSLFLDARNGFHPDIAVFEDFKRHG